MRPGSEIVASGGTSFALTIAGGILDLAGGTVSGGGIAFAGSGGVLQIDSNTMPTNPISGFAPGDTIDLRALTFGSTTTASFDPTSGTLIVTNDGTSDTLSLFGVASGTLFAVASDGHGGTFVTEAPLAGGTRWTATATGSWSEFQQLVGRRAAIHHRCHDRGGGILHRFADHVRRGEFADHRSRRCRPQPRYEQREFPGEPCHPGQPEQQRRGLVDYTSGQGGSTVSIGGALINTNTFYIGNAAGAAATTVSAASVRNSYYLVLGGGAQGAPTLTTTGDFTNAYIFNIDATSGQGGSTLSVGGTLTNNAYNLSLSATPRLPRRQR